MTGLEIEYKNRTHGNGHFFDPDTMRFFRSRIGAVRHKKNSNIIFFVTSEKPPHGDRMFSVRRMEEDGDINTVGEFCSMTSYQANKMLNELAS
jgi:hypothetical protein